MIRRCYQIVAAGAFASVVSCSNSAIGPVRTWSVHFSGMVQKVAGPTVPQAKVTMQVINLNGGTAISRGKCTGDTVSPLAGETGNDGRYELIFDSGGPPIFGCIFVDVTSVAGGQTLSGTTEVDSVLIGPTGLDKVPIDVTVRP